MAINIPENRNDWTDEHWAAYERARVGMTFAYDADNVRWCKYDHQLVRLQFKIDALENEKQAMRRSHPARPEDFAEYDGAGGLSHDSSRVVDAKEAYDYMDMLQACIADPSPQWNYVSDIAHPDHGGQVLVAWSMNIAGKDNNFVCMARFDCGKWDWNSKAANTNRRDEDIYAWLDLACAPPKK